MEKQFRNTRVEVIRGDITEQDMDAIVNAANSQLQHGGGVAGAIVQKGGPGIQEESDVWVKAWGGRVDVGSCAITSAGNLSARYVIHAVGPRMGEGNEDEKLRSAVLSCLRMADQRNLKTIAFPAISAGIFGFPSDRCADILLETAVEYILSGTRLERVVFCLFDDRTFGFFETALSKFHAT
ncbi:MAG TPA: macro domain-containing protein [bacterium]|nr:macro domain-containing protein [bacterium]